MDHRLTRNVQEKYSTKARMGTHSRETVYGGLPLDPREVRDLAQHHETPSLVTVLVTIRA